MRKNPKLNGLVCTAYDRAWRSIEISERQHAPKLFALIEDIVDAGYTDIEMVAAQAMGMLRGQAAPPRPQRPRLAWLARPVTA